MSSEHTLKINQGYAVEDVIENICSNTFFSDFTVRSPKYVKPNKQEKEIADILIPFDDVLIAFQIKTKNEDNLVYDRSKVEISRIERKVEETVNQFKTTKKAFDNDQIKDLISVRGLSLPFNKSRITNIIGIAVIDIIEPAKESKDKTGVFCPVSYDIGIPIHIFMRDEFEILLNVVDTLPDFIDYISIREFLKQKLSPITNELDILALYKMNPSLIEKCIEGKSDSIILTPDLWDKYESTYQDFITKKQSLNPEYIIDHIIDVLHKTVDYIPPIALPDDSNMTIDNSTENYLHIAHYLCRKNRKERKAIGEKIFEKLKKADDIGYGYCFFSNSEKSSGILFYSSNEKRQERFNKLYQLSASIYCINDLKIVVGITTEEGSAKTRSFDFLRFDGVNFSNKDEIMSFGKDLFHFKPNIESTPK